MDHSGKSNRFVEYEANNITKLSRLDLVITKRKNPKKFNLKQYSLNKLTVKLCLKIHNLRRGNPQ
jgi:hypothetical protein